jgi:hypothetical protein
MQVQPADANFDGVPALSAGGEDVRRGRRVGSQTTTTTKDTKNTKKRLE